MNRNNVAEKFSAITFRGSLLPFDLKKRAAGGIRQLSLTNPLNSQLDTNVALAGLGKKWNYQGRQSLL